MKRKTRGRVQVEVRVSFDRCDGDPGQVRKFEMLMSQLLKSEPNNEGGLLSHSKTSKTSEPEDDLPNVF